MRTLHRVWQNVRRGEHIDLYLTVVAAIVFVALNLFGVDVGRWMAPITLGALGLLATSLLGTRHHIDQQLQT
ncbi:MAG TPA: hypothetical protein VKE41_00765 [Roseiflexaceae bacterium]|nr:hypothetical protein [Roseiflexaceae bacterium]